jgi:hypothetical protein
MRAMPAASLRLFICILSTALAWRASIQITARPNRLSSVHSQLAVGPVSRPTRTTPGAFDTLQTRQSRQGQNQLRLLARPILPGPPHRSMSASTTRPVRHNAPSQLSIVARPHEDGLIRSWRADSLGLCLAQSGITPCCKTIFAARESNTDSIRHSIIAGSLIDVEFCRDLKILQSRVHNLNIEMSADRFKIGIRNHQSRSFSTEIRKPRSVPSW